MSIGDVCLVHRYLYYVKGSPIISDQQYDILEREAVRFEKRTHPVHFPGNDLEDSYSNKIKNTAIKVLNAI